MKLYGVRRNWCGTIDEPPVEGIFDDRAHAQMIAQTLTDSPTFEGEYVVVPLMEIRREGVVPE